MFVQWYSKQSCKWSKWRYISQDWLDSNPYTALKLSKGQRLRFAAKLPEGEQLHKSSPIPVLH